MVRDLAPPARTDLVDIIIPCWNNANFTIACLRSIKKYTENYRVILVDNGSTVKDRGEVYYEILDEDIPHLFIDLPKNIGFVKATNIGIAAAEGDVVLLNNDTEVSEGWLEDLWGGLWFGHGIIGPLADEGIESWQSLGNAEKFVGLKLPTAKNHFMPVKGMVAFFCVYITRDVIQDVGYLSEAYGIGFGDDDDYCARARARGHHIALATDTVIKHHHRTTFKVAYPEYKDMQVKNMAIFKRRNP